MERSVWKRESAGWLKSYFTQGQNLIEGMGCNKATNFECRIKERYASKNNNCLLWVRRKWDGEIKKMFWEDVNIAVETAKGCIFLSGDFSGRVDKIGHIGI